MKIGIEAKEQADRLGKYRYRARRLDIQEHGYEIRCEKTIRSGDVYRP